MKINKIQKLISKIEKNSFLPMENKRYIKKYIKNSINNKREITFYNWECPPRFLDTSIMGDKFISYDVDLEKIFLGKKIDNFTEIPRVIEKSKKEIAFLKMLKSSGVNFKFIKIIADTNAYYLTPESFRYVNKKKTKSKFIEFKKLIKNELKKYPGEKDVYLFSELIEKYKIVYEKIFYSSIKLLEKNPNNLLSKIILKQQINRTIEHIGLEKKNEIKNFAIKTIATYAAEGVIFEILNKNTKFSNCIWFNNHEMDNRTIEISNCYRKKQGLKKLPIIFWK